MSVRKSMVRAHSYCNAQKEYYTTKKKVKSKKKLYHIAYRACEKLLRLNLQESKMFRVLPRKLDPQGGLIVSLTSFPARINTVWIAIDSIMRQTFRPNRVLLYLTKEEFVGEMDGLPASLKRYIPLGLEVIFVDCNLRSHLKYFYALQQNPDSLVVTIDDDLYYPDYVIERLVNLHNKYPDAICANRACVMSFDENSNYKPYKQWASVAESLAPSNLTVALGYGGILYPAGLLTNKTLFDPEAIKDLCYTADDLWLKAIALTNNIGVATTGYMPHPPEIRLKRNVTLQSVNTSRLHSGSARTGNDVQWDSINERYNLRSLL